jgi:oligoendopeptidase F
MTSNTTLNTKSFLPSTIEITGWETIESYYVDLANREINSVAELEQWMADRSELEAFLEEDMGWRYIKTNCNTEDKALAESFQFFITEVQPKVAPYDDKLNQKLISSPYLEQLDAHKYEVLVRGVKKQLEIFREENIPLYTEIESTQHEYGIITGSMVIEVDGKEYTMPQASNFFKDTDRSKREDVYVRIKTRRLADKDVLNELFNKLIALRHKVALNAGYSNFRDYMFAAMGRFDYTVDDCHDFHQSVKEYIKPVCDTIDENRRLALGYDTLKPWDTEVDTEGKAPLKPSDTTAELLDKAIACFNTIDPFFGQCLDTMKTMGHLDLESRKGKAPGGFNYPLYQSNVPFIFMNSANSMRDLVTIVHEGGHAIHSFLSKDLELTDFKSTPSEIAEIASMAMELISMEHWDVIFTNPEDFIRAKKYQLEKAISALPWIAQIDKFQHWIYENPTHTNEQRDAYWLSLCAEFGSNVLDWSGHQDGLANQWQKQLHLYEVPFYYIEYGIAQLGAIAIWRNYKSNPAKTLEQYKEALKLGYTRPLPELYETAGIRFDFSAAYVKELGDFVMAEIKAL